MAFKLNESSQHEYCKKLVADILYKAYRVENRSCAWIEYPICSVEDNRVLDEYFFFESWGSALSEDNIKIFLEQIEEEKDEKIKKRMIDALKPENRVEQLYKDEFVPTYQFCKDNGLNPVAVVDIACCWKGSIREIWEITKSNPLTKEKVKKIFNTLDVGIHELLIYEIDVKDIMSISNIHDKPSKLYNDLVKKAKKWTVKKNDYENDYEQWKESIFENHKKYGYKVNIDYMEKEYQWLCGSSYGDDWFKAIFLYNKEHFDNISFSVNSTLYLCFECGNFYKDHITGKSNTCEKCCENDDKPLLRANKSKDSVVSYFLGEYGETLMSYKEYIKYFKEIYKKFGYKVEGTFNKLWDSYFFNYPPPSNAELRKYPPCFNCGIPSWLNKRGSEYFCNKCLKE
jgi:hypothetical protein